MWTIIQWYYANRTQSYRPNHNTIASTVYPWYCWSIYAPTKSITFVAKVDGLARKGEEVWSWCRLVLTFLPTQCEGKSYKALNDQFRGVQNDQALINPLSIDEMVGRSEIPACLPQTYAATFTRKYMACSSPATLKQLRLSNHSKPWKRSENAKWSSAKNEVSVGSLHHSD